MGIAWKLDTMGAETGLGLTREWLETNGLGGYASSTLLNCHTRKYHALLASRLNKPPGTWVLLNQLEEWIEVGPAQYALSMHQYPQTFFPDGGRNLVEYASEDGPRFVYQCGPIQVTRELLLLHERDVLLVRYSLSRSNGPVRLVIWPQFACRSIHAVVTDQDAAVSLAAELGHAVATLPASLPHLHFHASAQLDIQAEPRWFHSVQYERDAERGLDSSETLFAPGSLGLELQADASVIVAVATSDIGLENLAGLWDNERARRRQHYQAIECNARRMVAEEVIPTMETLLAAAEHHLIRLDSQGSAVHAGYHWFGPWGRDLLIALPGLAFLSGNMEHGVAVLTTIAQQEKDGLLPNFIHSDGTCVYTAADPALWFFWSVQQYMKYGGDLQVVRQLFWPVMKRIIAAYCRGTHNRIAVEPAGLLRAGAPGQAVSWMDVRLGTRPILARWGFMVELNALWYNAVCYATELAGQFDDPLPELGTEFCCRVRDRFVETFWDEDQQYLADTVNEFAVDTSIRPNQLLAVSLPYSPLTPAQQHAVVELVHDELFTPCGIRTLTPDDQRYHPNCQGQNWYRELAYHQGSACFWLLAHFADACHRVYGDTPRVCAIFAPVLEAVNDHLWEAGLGSISEIFDGDPPHTGRGAISQAWNVGEAIRLLYVLYRRQ